MDESSFEIDSTQLAEASRRFQQRRLARPAPRPDSDVTYLSAPSAEFARHAWDEAGHL
ncbi:MAG: hypothetical protein ABWX74_19095 [Aeromicrobium sp.]